MEAEEGKHHEMGVLVGDNNYMQFTTFIILSHESSSEDASAGQALAASKAPSVNYYAKRDRGLHSLLVHYLTT